ncbi:MAG TPA: uroporphyrinogen-III C-methyltransferase [Candidatus Limnocylindria bacterium]|nr:uroporphyrinogen-III C-methyltransferase [Candidatus Limnocylindria bacterium]
MTGRVHLVGAGPGDPGLLTVRAARLLAEADVVVADHLVSPALLAGVPPDALVVEVGQPHGAGPRLSQRDVEALLVEHARAGRRVVRLKNGDPMVFGRGGEEAAALRAAGVPFDVVPGVSSAVAAPAYAGIPLTHREHASIVTIATGHQASSAEGGALPELPWAELARQGGTLVFLMAVRQLAAVLDALVRHGLPPDRPAAVVQHATLARQRTIVATAGTLAAAAAAADVTSPAVVIVGDVVSLRAQVAWAERRPLAGRVVLVTRPRHQASALANHLEAYGAEVLAVPTIILEPPDDPAALERAVAAAGSYDWIVFTSTNGVRAFFDRMAAARRDVRELAGVRIAAIGPETARALDALMVRPAVVPEEYRAEALLAAFGAREMAGRRVLLPRAAGARAVLRTELERLGARVDDVATYRVRPPTEAEAAPLLAALDEGRLDVATFTSSSTVEHFVRLLGPERIAAMAASGRPLVASIGPVTSATARAAGLPVHVEARPYTTAALATALARHFCNEEVDPVGA